MAGLFPFTCAVQFHPSQWAGVYGAVCFPQADRALSGFRDAGLSDHGSRGVLVAGVGGAAVYPP